MSFRSRLSLNDKGYNEVKPGTLDISLDIYLMAEKKTGKPQLGDRVMKAVRQVIASNGAFYLQMTSVGSQIAQHVKEGEKKKRMGEFFEAPFNC